MTAALRVLLFDVDHTLLAAGGAGFRAMDRAFVELYGVENATRGIVPDGKTDPMLFGEALVRCRLAAAGSPPPPELVRRYETLFPEEMAAPPAELMPGVRELLTRSPGSPGAARAAHRQPRAHRAAQGRGLRARPLLRLRGVRLGPRRPAPACRQSPSSAPSASPAADRPRPPRGHRGRHAARRGLRPRLGRDRGWRRHRPQLGAPAPRRRRPSSSS